jgi:Fic family protein
VGVTVSSVKIVRRGNRHYLYLVQTYRWNGSIHKKQIYLGTSAPKDLGLYRSRLEQDIWNETWLNQFDEIRERYQRHRRSLPSSVLSKEREDFVVDFTYNTNRIEGSTLSFEDTRRLLIRGSTPALKPLKDILETQKHAALLRRLMEVPEPVDLAHLLRWHKELFSETKPDIGGRLRDYEVRILGSRHIPPPALEVRPMMIELLRSVNRAKHGIHPVQRSGEFHFRFEHTHPFGDGNGRIGRLAMNVLLAKEGFPMLNISYNRRRGYYSALESASLLGDPRPFLRWFFLRFSRENRFFLRK